MLKGDAETRSDEVPYSSFYFSKQSLAVMELVNRHPPKERVSGTLRK